MKKAEQDAETADEMMDEIGENVRLNRDGQFASHPFFTKKSTFALTFRGRYYIMVVAPRGIF